MRGESSDLDAMFQNVNDYLHNKPYAKRGEMQNQIEHTINSFSKISEKKQKVAQMKLVKQ